LRQIVLDTETTGLEPSQGHRVIEIGGVELDSRRPTGRHFHKYLNPDREIDDGAYEVHGISLEFLADKPRFGDILEELLAFIDGAELIIHNAPFDVAFLDHELERVGHPQRVADLCHVIDSLALARRRHPGQKNSLDALCRRYEVDNSARTLHGALLDAEILADVYLAMTGGQVQLFATGSAREDGSEPGLDLSGIRLDAGRPPLRVIEPSPEELAAHEQWLARLSASCEAGPVWQRQESAGTGGAD